MLLRMPAARRDEKAFEMRLPGGQLRLPMTPPTPEEYRIPQRELSSRIPLKASARVITITYL